MMANIFPLCACVRACVRACACARVCGEPSNYSIFHGFPFPIHFISMLFFCFVLFIFFSLLLFCFVFVN